MFLFFYTIVKYFFYSIFFSYNGKNVGNFDFIKIWKSFQSRLINPSKNELRIISKNII